MEAFFALIVLGGFVAFLALCVAVPSLMRRVRNLEVHIDALEHDFRRLKEMRTTAASPIVGPAAAKSKESSDSDVADAPDEPAKEVQTPSRPLPAHLTSAPPVARQPIEVDASESGDADIDREEEAPTTPPPIPVNVPDASFASTERGDVKERPWHDAEPPRRNPIAEFVSRMGPDDPDVSLETALATYWLPRIGALFVSVAAVFFLTLAMQQFGPPVRVAVGYTISGVVLSAAWWLEKKYSGFARVLFGAGFALTYLVTFATYYFPPARVFDHPGITLSLLAAIIAIWAGIATVRRSPTIALIAVVLGHTTIALASFTLDDPGNYSGAGILLLSAGSAYFLLRDKWYYIAAVGLLGSYMNQFLLMTQSESQGLVSEFTIGMGILAAYYFIFALAELFSDKELREHIPNWFRSLFVTVNTACMFALGSLLVEGFEFSEYYHHLFRYAMAVVLLAIGVLYLTVRGRDKLYNAYITKGTVLITLGLSAQFDGAYLTTWLAVQTVVLLVSSQRSSLLITRALAIGLAMVTFAHGVVAAIEGITLLYGEEGFAAQLLQYTLTITAFLVASLVYEKTDWRSRAPRSLPILPGGLLWRLEFISEHPDGIEEEEGHRRHLMAPACYAIAAGLLALFYVPHLTEAGDRLPVFGMATLALFAAGIGLRSLPVATLSLLMAAAALFAGTLEFFDTGTRYIAYLLGVVPLVAVGILGDEKLLPNHRDTALVRSTGSGFLLHCGAAWLTLVFCVEHFDPPQDFMVIALAGVAYALASSALAPWATGVAGVALLIAADALWADFIHAADSGNRHPITFILIALAFAADRWFGILRRPGLGPLAYVAGILVAMMYAFQESSLDWYPFAWAWIGAIGGIGYGLAFRSPAGAISGLAVTAVASIAQLGRAYDGTMENYPVVAGFLLAAAIWVACERLVAFASERFGVENIQAVGGIFVAFATVLIVCMLERIPELSEVYLTISWAVLAFVLFGAAIAMNSAYYRYASLSIFVLASLRVLFVDTRELDPMPRVLAWAGLGLAMMVVGFGYVKFFPSSRIVPGEDES